VLETLFDIAILVNEIDTNILSPDASSGQNRSLVNTGAGPPCKLRGRAISVIFCSESHYGFTTVRDDVYFNHNTAMTKQWTAKWPYIANAIFRIKIHGA